MAWREGLTEEANQKIWHQNIDRFGFTPKTAYPTNTEKGTRRVQRDTAIDGTILYDNFTPQVRVDTWFEDGRPIVSRAYGYSSGIMLWMGVAKLSFILKHGPTDDEGITTEGTHKKPGLTWQGKYKGNPFSTLKDIMALPQEEKIKIGLGEKQWNVNIKWGTNPLQPGVPWPQDWPNYEATPEEMLQWVEERYPSFHEVLYEKQPTQAAKDLKEVGMTPDKMELIDYLKKLERQAFGGDLFETVVNKGVEDNDDRWQIIIPTFANKVKPVMLKHGFMELDEATMLDMITMPDSKVPPVIKLALEKLQDGDTPSVNYLIRAPRGEQISRGDVVLNMLRVKKSDWKSVLKYSKIVPHEKLTGTLQQLKDTHPMVFTSEIDEQNLTNTIMDFRTEIDTYKEHGHENVLELDKLKIVLENLSEGVGRLEQLA